MVRSMKGRARAAIVAGAAAAALAGAASEAQALPIGAGVPVGQISIQLYSFNTYVQNDPAKLEEVLSELHAAGYRAVEPYSFHGLSETAFRALLDEYDLRAVARHGSTDENGWEAEIGRSKVLGQEYMGSGGTASPGIGSLRRARSPRRRRSTASASAPWRPAPARRTSTTTAASSRRSTSTTA